MQFVGLYRRARGGGEGRPPYWLRIFSTPLKNCMPPRVAVKIQPPNSRSLRFNSVTNPRFSGTEQKPARLHPSRGTPSLPTTNYWFVSLYLKFCFPGERKKKLIHTSLPKTKPLMWPVVIRTFKFNVGIFSKNFKCYFSYFFDFR